MKVTADLTVEGLCIVSVDHNASNAVQTQVPASFCGDLHPVLSLRLEPAAGIALRRAVLAVLGAVLVLPEEVRPPLDLIALYQRAHKLREGSRLRPAALHLQVVQNVSLNCLLLRLKRYHNIWCKQ